MQHLSGNLRPERLTSLMNMSLVLRLPCDVHRGRSSSNVPRLPTFLEMLQNFHVLLTFGKVQNPLRLLSKTTWSEHVVFLAAHFDLETCFAPQQRTLVSTSQFPKSGPTLSVFNTFDLEMCFAPWRRFTFLRHLNLQKRSYAVRCFRTFWLSKRASRHSRVHFFDI